MINWNALAAEHTAPSDAIEVWEILLLLAGLLASLIGPILAAIVPNAVMSWLVARRRRPKATRWLRASNCVDAAEVLGIGRFPLDPVVTRSGQLGISNLLRLAMLRPSSPKPILLLAGPPIVQEPSSPQEFLGGSRLILTPYSTESSWLLLHSIRSASCRGAAAVKVGTLQNYLAEEAEPTTYNIAPQRAWLESERKDCVIAYTADPNCSDDPNDLSDSNRQQSDDALQLLYNYQEQVDAEVSAAERHDEEAAIADQKEAQDDRGSQTPRPPSNGRDPWRGTRLYRYALQAVLIGLSVAGSWLLFGAAWGSDPHTALLLAAIAVTFAVWYATIMFFIYNSVAYFAQELPYKDQGTATATRCLVDGRSARVGHYRSLNRSNRFRNEMRY